VIGFLGKLELKSLMGQ